mgnify:CR=1 FL=1
MKISDVFDLHYQQFLIQIEGTKKEAEELLEMMQTSFRTGKDGRSKLSFVIIGKDFIVKNTENGGVKNELQ